MAYIGECEKCGMELESGYSIYQYDNTHFCTEDCVEEYILGAERPYIQEVHV